jgi:hypothetical protein
MWRVFSGIVAAVWVGAGYNYHSQIDDKAGTYQEKADEFWKFINDPNSGIKREQIDREKQFIDNLHSEIESLKLYRNICYGAGGIGATSLTLSIVLPIITKK